MLKQGFEWDTCQMPINVMDAHYRSFQNEVLPELNRRGIGCIGMKSLGGDGQMIEAGLTPQQARGYALSLPISTLVCGIESMDNLRQDLEIARNLTPMSEVEMNALREQVQTKRLTAGTSGSKALSITMRRRTATSMVFRQSEPSARGDRRESAKPVHDAEDGSVVTASGRPPPSAKIHSRSRRSGKESGNPEKRVCRESRRSPVGANPTRPIGRSAGSNQSGARR